MPFTLKSTIIVAALAFTASAAPMPEPMMRPICKGINCPGMKPLRPVMPINRFPTGVITREFEEELEAREFELEDLEARATTPGLGLVRRPIPGVPRNPTPGVPRIPTPGVPRFPGPGVPRTPLPRLPGVPLSFPTKREVEDLEARIVTPGLGLHQPTPRVPRIPTPGVPRNPGPRLGGPRLWPMKREIEDLDTRAIRKPTVPFRSPIAPFACAGINCNGMRPFVKREDASDPLEARRNLLASPYPPLSQRPKAPKPRISPNMMPNVGCAGINCPSMVPKPQPREMVVDDLEARRNIAPILNRPVNPRIPLPVRPPIFACAGINGCGGPRTRDLSDEMEIEARELEDMLLDELE